MRRVLRTLVVLHALLPVCALAGNEKVLVELNSVESQDNRCLVSFVVENKSEAALDSMRLDLVAFATDGGILRRLITEMGPLHGAKTMVKAFVFDADCRQIGAILVNDVTACAPAEPGACLDGLGLSSRVKAIRFYK
jgi:hypothetical protein